MKNLKISLYTLLAATLIFTSCSDDDDVIPDGGETSDFVGAVYAMTNGNGQVAGNIQGANTVISYGRNADGTLTPIGPVSTGGNGGDFDGGEGLDPLISAYALTKTDDNKNLLAVNAGSNTITSFNIQDDFSLVAAGSPQPTGADGPNSIAYTSSNADGVKGIVYVSNITRSEFLTAGEPAQQGTVTGFWLLEDGTLSPIGGSTRNLTNRPSAVQFSPDGNWLVVASINAGAAGLASGNEDEITVYAVNTDGTLSANQVAGATSTLRDNTEGRNLPSAIGFQIVGNNYVVVTEAREFQPNGMPPAFPALQDGSVSTWQIQGDGSLNPISLDVRSGEGNTGRTACWLDFTADGSTFFVSNAIEAGLASYSFNSGVVALIDQTAASGTGTGGADNGPDAFAQTDGWIDMWISDDGQYLYQLYGLDGTIGIYRVNGQSLEFIGEESGNLPDTNTQGIVAI
ncbi:beta-propeller fold lactonase family protein [uncultured Aquimarina sp.]|uniref:beta-propeller fold lactonase family protein n=1 Tax=uncultured Aquimarina sp. TaxID=575652 RepID=UPI002602BB3E|nr:beta-propeller fold lactonase family protein [uncultured Aquimarina sp.]